MKRSEFLRVAGLLGLSIPIQSFLVNCSSEGLEDGPVTGGSFNGSVFILGAGAAGMAAGHLLAQQGIDFRILEAGPTYGGRMKRTTTFTDFPIPLGAEWLHSSRADFDAIVNDPSIQVTTQTRGYNGSTDMVGYYDGSLSMFTLESAFGGDYDDQKFINSTWFDFFDTYVAPGITDRMTFNTQITAINYSDSKVMVTDSSGASYSADRVIVTVPLKILQRGDIAFTPDLPANKRAVISEATVWSGFKAFFKFSEKFYPTFLAFPDSETNDGQRLYYDAAYGQTTNDNVLGLFSVGLQAEQYQQFSGNTLRDYMLNELDTVFDGRASETYIEHIVQNWNAEPFAGAAYLADVEGSSISTILSQSVDGKLYFAGEAYTKEDDWAAVHNAARAARDAVRELLA